MKTTSQRCPWCEADDLYRAYHDEEWGVPVRDDRALFEMLILEGAQAGLSWHTVLKKRDSYREAFDGFDAERIARYDQRRQEKLLQNPGIIRNRLKVAATIQNGREYLRLQQELGSFSDFLWGFVNGRPIQNRFTTMKDVPARTAESDAMSKALLKQGFKFVGSTICYAFMQAVGMTNDHLTTCPRHAVVAKLGR